MQKYKFLFPSDDEIFGRFKVSMVKVVPFKVMGFFNLMQMFYLLFFFVLMLARTLAIFLKFCFSYVGSRVW